jgi:hypothetical protein
MGFYSYIQYKKCFGGVYVREHICSSFIEAGLGRNFMTSDGRLFCIKQE